MTEKQIKNRLNRMNPTAQAVKLGDKVVNQEAAINTLNTEAEGIPTVVAYKLKAADIGGSGAAASITVNKAVNTILAIHVDSTGTFKPVASYEISENLKTLTLAAVEGSEFAANDVVIMTYL